ncbi:hypothetical protein [Mucilaginibacter sp. L3T2-6]|nr:hypothetical protein [Mucilaginibacter sp. L3T2-6]MDO3645065.1 hypothetical protein [Mucilaginibacter sp. L3T2-6]MDV6217516.1 hypothetical protein [Mucilaginibacter sp. L3T2-6]
MAQDQGSTLRTFTHYKTYNSPVGQVATRLSAVASAATFVIDK